MAAAARIHGIERGKDLRAYPLFAFGGAGPVHCWQVAKILKVPRILLPFGAGAMSAYGLLAAPLAFDFVRTRHERLDAPDWSAVNRLLEDMEAEGRERLARAGVAAHDVRIKRVAEMRYLGQGHEVEAALPGGPLSPDSLGPITSSFEAAYRALYHRLPQGALDGGSLAVITAAFETAYRALYSRTPLGVPIEALNWRAVVSGPVPEISVSGPGPDARVTDSAKPAPKGTRKAYFPEAKGYVDTPVYDRYALTPGAVLAGPAIIEERESTTVAGPGARVTVDSRLTLILES